MKCHYCPKPSKLIIYQTHVCTNCATQIYKNKSDTTCRYDMRKRCEADKCNCNEDNTDYRRLLDSAEVCKK